MKIKKYEARTEQEAINRVKDELGLDALVLNIKKIQPRGFFAFLRKPIVEVTAAYEEKNERPRQELKKPELPKLDIEKIAAFPKLMNAEVAEPRKEPLLQAESREAKREFFVTPMSNDKIAEQEEKIKTLQNKLASTEGLLEKVVGQLTASAQNDRTNNRKYENTMIQLFYDTLLRQGVTMEIAEKILDEINQIDDNEKIDINLLVKIVYNTIMGILGTPETVDISSINKNSTKCIVFIGPTGVGKTTTIAKLSSDFVLNHRLSVGLITADTYRIAAVEQLKTYADILNIDVGVVYSVADLKQNIKHMGKIKDIILIDTAGRSHKNDENLKELEELLSCVPDSERYLVLSLTTKYEDLVNIIGRHSTISDFKIIFTKMDETTCLGSILNVCYTTGKKFSYITYGQNVPEDIEVIQPEKIAKALLGVGGDV